MKKLFFLLPGILLTVMACAQELTLPLYPAGNVPNFQKTGETEIRQSGDILWVRLVQTPDMTAYLPPRRNATGEAIIICPGGGYGGLAFDWEGTEVAKWLNAKGIAAFVLKYRLPNSKSNITPHLSPLLDARRALRLVRANAGRWHIRKDRIGIMGFSAGGHLASSLLTHFDEGNPSAKDSVEQQSSRPDFGVLIYPVVSMSKPIMHAGSRNNLIGEHADTSLANFYSGELQVQPNTPPTFLLHAMDDEVVPVENSLLFFQAMKDKKVSGELHVFPKGGHGFALAVGNPALEGWKDLCIAWIRETSQSSPKKAGQ